MELHQLRYFCAVAEGGNFSRAAERSHVSQPSLSQQIGKLEAELGVRLFDRLRAGARLTAAGRALLPRARAALAELEAARGEVAERSATLRGPLAVGVIPTIAPYLLPAPLRAFTRRYPEARLSVVEEITPLLLDRLRAGSLDLAVVALPLPGRGREFAVAPLLEESACAVLPARHRLAARARLNLRELRPEPFLLLRDGHCFRDTAVEACRRARWQPQVVFESGQFRSILSMVGAGLGVSLVPAMAVEPHPGCCFVPLADNAGRRIVAAASLRGRHLPRLAQAFVEELRKAAAPVS